jgi:hypothetical protein
MIAIAADPRHLGARIGITAVLHTWGSALTHHPHVHMIVPGGGVSLPCRSIAGSQRDRRATRRRPCVLPKLSDRCVCLRCEKNWT